LTAKLIALLLAALAFAGLGLWGQQQHLAATKAKAEVQTLTKTLEGTKAALDASVKDGKAKAAINLAKQRRINQLAATAAQTQKALNEALKENRAWADARVPDGVLSAIDPTYDPAPAGPGVDRASPDPLPTGQ